MPVFDQSDFPLFIRVLTPFVERPHIFITSIRPPHTTGRERVSEMPLSMIHADLSERFAFVDVTAFAVCSRFDMTALVSKLTRTILRLRMAHCSRKCLCGFWEFGSGRKSKGGFSRKITFFHFLHQKMV